MQFENRAVVKWSLRNSPLLPLPICYIYYIYKKGDKKMKAHIVESKK